MSIARILLHEGICQTRAVALDAQDRAVGLFHSSELNAFPKLGDILTGIIAKSSPADGGCFVRLDEKHEGFLSHRSAGDMIEGQRHFFRIAAEARAGKLARVAITDEAARAQLLTAPLERWQASLPDGGDIKLEVSDDISRDIDAVFEDAAAPICGLPHGGRLQISPTPALVAIDVDTVGRIDKGRASVRAKAINRDAAEEAARQIALRNLGGNIVLDCIGPLARTDGPAIKAAFVTSFRAASSRKVSCLPPSPLGMMEAIIEYGAQPLHELLRGPDGAEAVSAKLLSGLRRMEIEATARSGDHLNLMIPASAYDLYQVHRKKVDTALHARFGGRIIVTESQTQKVEITDQ